MADAPRRVVNPALRVVEIGGNLGAMCGRFSQSGKEVEVPMAGTQYRFAFVPRYNIAPSQRVGVLLARGNELVKEDFRWGFVPHWTKEKPKIAPINARAEGVLNNRMFAAAIRARRCLVPACGWFEWQADAGGKQPIRIVRRDQKPMFFAGIYDHAEPQSVGPMDTFAILTREVAPELVSVHSRMPVVLAEKELVAWLDPEGDRYRKVLDHPLLDGFEFYPVSKIVNAPSNDTPEALKPVA